MINIAISPSVSLPRVDSGVLVALVHSLMTSFKAAQATPAHVEAVSGTRRKAASTESATSRIVVSENVSECMVRLEAANAHLETVRRAAQPGASKGPSRAARRGLVGRCRRAWSVLRRQLLVWRDVGAIAKLPEATQHAFARVFGEAWASPDLRGNAMTLWIAGRDTLNQMKSEGVADEIISLGGEGVLADVRAVHAELGAAFGVTKEVPANDTSVGVGEAVASVQTVLREYVIKVHAMISPKAPGSEALVARLLAPFDAVSANSRAVTKPTKVKAVNVKDTTAKNATPNAPAAPVLKPTGTDR